MAGKKGASGGNRKPTLSPKVQEETRAKIQTTTIVNKLVSFVKGDIQMEAAQVTAATVLLKKTLPDLQSIELKGDKENPIEHSVTVNFE